MKPDENDCKVELHRNVFHGQLTRLIRVSSADAEPEELDLRKLTHENLALLDQVDELLWSDL